MAARAKAGKVLPFPVSRVDLDAASVAYGRALVQLEEARELAEKVWNHRDREARALAECVLRAATMDADARWMELMKAARRSKAPSAATVAEVKQLIRRRDV